MATGSKTSVTNSTTAIVAAGERRGIVISNPTTATEILWVKFGAAAVVNEGIPIAPGATLTATYDGEFNMPPTQFDTYSLAVNGIYSTETNDVSYHTI